MQLADRYHELMTLRAEALQKYRANVMGTMKGPPGRAYFPVISYEREIFRGRRAGPLAILDRPPVWRYVEKIVAAARQPLNVLEFGPGNGDLAAYLRWKHAKKISRYFGIERDRAIAGAYERLDSIAELTTPIDLVVASEVIEHMTADDFYSGVLQATKPHLNAGAQLVLSTPNPVAPGGIARDFSHVQNYPWYDLYGMLRLEFEDVDVHRTLYAWTLPRVLFLLPRIAACTIIELDWCDGLVCVARGPKHR
jgi:methyltransferase family protein